MKKMNVLTVLLATAVLVLSTACSKNGGSAPTQDGQVAALDLPQECQGPQDYQQNQNWNQYQNAGCSEYNWDQGRFRRGGCPTGTFAACGAGIGMICMPANVYGSNQVAWFNYRQGTRSASFCGYEGKRDRERNRGGRSSCSYNTHNDRTGTIGRACLIGQPNTCGYGACIPVSRRSQIGVCAQ